jgi:hypothetical protein
MAKAEAVLLIREDLCLDLPPKTPLHAVLLVVSSRDCLAAFHGFAKSREGAVFFAERS